MTLESRSARWLPALVVAVGVGALILGLIGARWSGAGAGTGDLPVERVSITSTGDLDRAESPVQLQASKELGARVIEVRIPEGSMATEQETASPTVTSAPEEAPELRHGLVVARASGMPLANAEIRSVRHTLLATTGADGRFSVGLTLAHRPQPVDVRVPGFGRRQFEIQSLDPARPDILEVDEAATLHGFVDALPEPGQVRARVDTSHLHRGVRPMLSTGRGEAVWYGAIGASGRYEIAGLPPGVPLGIRVVSPDGNRFLKSLPEAVRLAPGESRQLDLGFGHGSRITGRVVEQDLTAAPRISVGLYPSKQGPYGPIRATRVAADSAISDEGGGFVFEDVLPGSWIVGLKPMARGFEDKVRMAPVSRHVEVVKGEDHALELTLIRGLYVDGRILYDGAAAPAGAYCWGHGSDGSLVSATAARDGTFRVGPLVPGPVTLRASARPSSEQPSLISSSEEMTFEAGFSNAVLPLRRGGAITVTAVDSSTGECVPALISVSGPEMNGRSSGYVPEFVASGLVPSTLSIRAETLDGRAGRLQDVVVQAGEHRSDVIVPLESAGFLQVRSESGRAGARLLYGEQVQCFLEVSPGRSEKLMLPPGEYVLQVTMRDGWKPGTGHVQEDLRTLNLLAGQVIEVNL